MSNYIKPVVTGIPNVGIKPNKAVDKSKNADFDRIFENQLKEQEIKFSRHAAQRLEERNIEISQAVRDKVGKAIDLASDKGIKDSLILTDNVAFVVNVNSKTVVTAIDKESLDEKVFTNIDGAVYL